MTTPKQNFVISILAVLSLASITMVRAANLSEADAKKQFADVFGSEVQNVTRTPDTGDDLQLAKSLLEAAEQNANQPNLLLVLCRNAAQLAGKDKNGAALAERALRLVIAKAPDHTASALKSLTEILQTQYQRARGDAKKQIGETLILALVDLADTQVKATEFDEANRTLRRATPIARVIQSPQEQVIKSRLSDLANKQRIVAQIDSLKKRLAANPKDTEAAKKLIVLYVTELDSPQQARKYTFLISDKMLQEKVKLASSSLDMLSTKQAGDLGDWYRSLSSEASTDDAKYNVLIRARKYYVHVTKTAKEGDAALAKATLVQPLLESQIAKLEEKVTRRPTQSPYVVEVLKDKPIVYLQFDDSAAVSNKKVFDSAREGKKRLHGKYHGKVEHVAAVPGLTGKAVKFDGSTSHITIPLTSSNAPSEFTIEFWLKTSMTFARSSSYYTYTGPVFFSNGTSGRGSGDLLLTGYRYSRTRDDSRLMFITGPQGRSDYRCYARHTDLKINDGAWHHVVVTRSSTGSRAIYIDGVRRGYNSDSGGAVFNTRELHIGGDPAQKSNAYLSGEIDDLAIYDSVLTPERIAAHYNIIAAKLPKRDTVKPPSVPKVSVGPKTEPKPDPKKNDKFEKYRQSILKRWPRMTGGAKNRLLIQLSKSRDPRMQRLYRELYYKD